MLFNFNKPKIKPVVLVLLDGWGLAPPGEGNAVTQAKTPNFDSFFADYPHGELIASGESVGLPANEVGNSEVGHLTAGVGRVIYQSLKRINLAIETGEFYENRAIVDAINHCKQNNSNLHIMGLASSGNVHSSYSHLEALLQLCRAKDFERVFLHLFLDGRDAPPKDGANIIEKVQRKIDSLKLGSVATVSGRYYAMDRDGRWDRVQAVYDAMVSSKGQVVADPIQTINSYYQAGTTDEFIPPTVIQNTPRVSDNDACVYFNFRVDRARELTMPFILEDFETLDITKYGFDIEEKKKNRGTFKRTKKLNNLFFVTMTEYEKNLPVSAIAFPPQTDFQNSLPEVFSNKGLRQVRIAESEKERMVTFYFSGMTQKRFPGEDVSILPSPRVDTYDKKPEMSVKKIIKEFKSRLKKDVYSLFVMNIANPDMVAHSGSIPATARAIEHVDKALGDIVSETLKRNGTVIISADHGNAEEMLTFAGDSFYFTTEQGLPNTDHSGNPVPVLIISNQLKGNNRSDLRGTLADLAPTILAIMNIPMPEAMQGRDLLGSSSTKVMSSRAQRGDLNNQIASSQVPRNDNERHPEPVSGSIPK